MNKATSYFLNIYRKINFHFLKKMLKPDILLFSVDHSITDKRGKKKTREKKKIHYNKLPFLG